MRAVWLYLLLGLGVGLDPGDGSDVVVLEGGKRLEGRVVYEDRELLILRQGSRDTEVEMRTVERVDSLVRNLDALLDRDLKASSTDVGESHMLAEQARESGLPGEAEVFAWRMLAKDPANETAHRFLEHKKRTTGWAVPLPGRAAVPFDKRLTLAKDWGNAWEFSTLHYRLRTNMPLDQALHLAIDLERLYLAFFELFAVELRLFEICEPMNVQIHADASSYPESANEVGRYEASNDTLYIDASVRFSMEVLVHEATHQLLYDTAIRERTYSGQIPGWLDEGLAEYVAGCAVGGPHQLHFEPGRVNMARFRTHAEAEEPYSLSRILAFSSADFWTSSRQDLKYAQVYTLVHFCLNADQARHRAAFFEFLRGAYRGQSSPTDFKKCLSVEEEEEWEKAWMRYVEERAYK